ncbi:MAG: TiaS agmantine-binding domain-containing protein [Sulfolobales archaeon]
MDQKRIKREELIEVYVGIDDTDRFLFGCSTNFLREFISELIRSGLSKNIFFGDYPYLTRLNPSIPFKTRGNGAVSIHLYTYEHTIDEIIEIIKSLSDKIDSGEGVEPGIVFLSGVRGDTLSLLREYYIRALTDIIQLEISERLIRKLGGRIILRGRGLIGALASVAHHFIENDCTYEILGYSLRNNDVYIDPEKVYLMNEATYPLTFNNIDPETKKILIRSRLGRPVVLGIRGESPEVLLKAVKILDPSGVDEYLIFKTNQATDQHLIPRKLSEAKPYRTGLFEVLIDEEPVVMRGGDIFISVSDPYDRDVKAKVAIYREFGKAREIVRKLVRGDLVLIGGSVKPISGLEGSDKVIINVEMIKILRLTKRFIEKNPLCPRCGARMVSRGSGKGFKCPKCGYIDPLGKKLVEEIPRSGIEENIILKPPIRNMKHLSKPLQRYGREKICRKRNILIDLSNFYIR